ncbi:MFS transporter [Halalkalibacterium ligniniphilum]|uniref:MFS transporter n=1 Tax=Halalkalibacterium ligniniphilum TaxID=1134413 RepID=UPI001F30B7C0|nr:MFS transporter [Halalkalibacterium ligniniphilum]
MVLVLVLVLGYVVLVIDLEEKEMGVGAVYRLKAYLFFAYSTMTVVISYIPVYFKAEGLTAGEVGILMAVGPLATILAQPLWGFLSDKYKTIKRMLILALIGLLVTGAVFLFISSFIGYLIMMFVLFIFMSPITALGDSLSQKTAHQHRISFGHIRMWGSLGFAFTSLVTGYILTAIGVQYILLPMMFMAIIALWVAFGLQDAGVTTKPVTIVSAAKIGLHPRLFFFLVCTVFISVTHRANDSFLGIYLAELGGPEAFIGWAWFIGVTAEAVVFATSRYWFQRFSALTFVFISACFYGIRWILMSLVSVPWLLLPLQLFHGVTFGIFYIAAFSYVSRLIPDHLQATGHVLFITTFFGLSGIIGSLFGGWMVDTFSISSLYTVLGIFAFLGGIGVLFYHLIFGKSILSFS